ncbi:hypothetical protein GMJLKIPL_5743 [Methylobacterium isbiliense]|uniref:DUF4276 family protein n=1 Tax=Methylobacterium isbiliense TaxID=315478 RepID=A0ABQ4SQ30_9HYPH|nr:hypothetical protein GMJLKIPL_5743 [Methylobacterium isbiliense]
MWLVVGLFCEGPTDGRFLPTIIHRTLLAILVEQSAFDVELQEQIIPYAEKSNEERAQAICRERASVDLFVVHADASRLQSERVQDTIVGQIQATASAACGVRPERIIPLLPIREMEAWVLADPDAIARALGYDAGWPERVERGWQPERAEAEPDPKRTLDAAIRSLAGGRRGRRSPGAEAYFDRIADEVGLSCLGRLASYQRFRTDLQRGFTSLRRPPSLDPHGRRVGG